MTASPQLVPDVPVPPPPVWFRRAAQRAPLIRVDESVEGDVPRQRLLRRIGDLSCGVMASAALHLTILVILGIWFFVPRHEPKGIVINCEILAEDAAVAEQVNPVVPILQPDEPPPGGDIRLDVESVGGQQAAAGDLLVGAGAFDGQAVAGEGIEFFGNKAQGQSFVFVVDCSGSMRHDGRFTLAKREINRALERMHPQQSFFLYLYSNAARPMLDAKAPTSLTPATPETQNAVRSWLRPLQPDGGTQPVPALKQALELEPEVIFFLTDGEIPEETVEIVGAATDQGTVIHTTTLGSREGQAMLQQIADATGGNYRHVPGMPEFSNRRLPDRDSPIPEERVAEAKLRRALHYLKQGYPRTGRRWLEQVVSEYPGTTQARDAQKVLSAL
jgi:hypothetical protein